MARRARENRKGADYHVFNRGDEGNAIFAEDEDKAYFLHLLREGVERYSITLHAYCVMSNHYHLALRNNKANMSDFMHFLGSGFGNRISRKGWIGHVFAGRFKSICVEQSDYLLLLMRYIHLNPVEAGIAGAPLEYEWSSYRFFRPGCVAPCWVDHTWLNEHFGDEGERAKRRYRRFVEFPLIGRDSRRDEMLREAIARSRWKKDHAGVAPSPSVQVDLDMIGRVVMANYGITCLFETPGVRQGCLRRARSAFVYLARELTTSSNAEIGAYVGIESSSGVTHRLKRTILQLDENSPDSAKFREELSRMKLSLLEQGG